eukprot:1021282-Rhodomonas_salina.2
MCNYTLGEPITCSCQAAPNSSTCERSPLATIADMHGALCMGQLTHDGNGGFELFGSASSCLGDMSQLSADSESSPLPYLAGKVNNFVVTDVHTGSDRMARDRKLGGMSMVSGELIFELSVGNDVSAVVAWFSPSSFDATPGANVSLSLPGCAGHNNSWTACAVSAGGCASGGCSADYWSGFPDIGLPVSSVLRTLVTLCATSSLPPHSNCSSHPITNFHSPVPSFPLIIEVPITPGIRNLANFRGAEQANLRFECNISAPHPPFYFKASDADGHWHSQSILPGLSAGSSCSGVARCFLGGAAGEVLEAGVWPAGQCSGAGALGLPCAGIDAGECASKGGGNCSGLGPGALAAAGPGPASGSAAARCRGAFDFAPLSLASDGTLLKLSSSLSAHDPSSPFFALPPGSHAVSQHLVATVDFPLVSQGASSLASAPPPSSWRDGS